MPRAVTQFEYAGQELAPHMGWSREVTPINSRGKWEILLVPRDECDQALAVMRRELRRAPNPNNVLVKMNFRDRWGKVEIDTDHQGFYLFHFEDLGANGS